MLARLADSLRSARDLGDAAAFRTRALIETIPAALRLECTPREFLDWAESHRTYSQTLAECLTEVCAKPEELSVYLIAAIVEEMLDEA